MFCDRQKGAGKMVQNGAFYQAVDWPDYDLSRCYLLKKTCDKIFLDFMQVFFGGKFQSKTIRVLVLSTFNEHCSWFMEVNMFFPL